MLLRSELARHFLDVTSDSNVSPLHGSARDSLRNTIEYIKLFDEGNPVKFLGISCNVPLCVTILSTLVTVYVSLFQYAASVSTAVDEPPIT